MFYDADDLDSCAVHAEIFEPELFHAKQLVHGIVIRPGAPGQFFVDQHHIEGTLLVVRLVQEAARQQSDTHRLEVPGSPPTVIGSVEVPLLFGDAYLSVGKHIILIAAVQRQRSNSPRRFDPRERFQALPQLQIEIDANFCLSVLEEGQRYREGKHIFGVEPGLHSPGGASASLPFQIDPKPNPLPSLDSLDPTATVEGGEAFTLRVLGSKFIESSQVRWNGEDRTTLFISSEELRAEISDVDIANDGQAQITVFNPAPAGGVSDVQSFTIESRTAPEISNVMVLKLDADSAQVTFDLEDPDGDVTELSFTWMLNNLLVETFILASPGDIDLVGFTSGTLTRTFSSLEVPPFGLFPNSVTIVATDAHGLKSEEVKAIF